MKETAIIKYAFTLNGLALLIGAFILYRNESAFLSQALTTVGTVVDLAPSRSGNSATYKPVVRFTSEDGKPVEFISASGSYPPSYAKGETVEELYIPSEPQHAEINDFFSLWGVTLILAGLGCVFFLIGTGIIIKAKLRNTRKLAPGSIR